MRLQYRSDYPTSEGPHRGLKVGYPGLLSKKKIQKKFLKIFKNCFFILQESLLYIKCLELKSAFSYSANFSVG